MLQYDDSAFYFFALAIMSLYLVPSWYTIISKLIKVFKTTDENIGAVPRTSAEKKKAEELKKENSAAKILSSRGFLINLAFTVALSILFYYLLKSVSEDGQVNSFDPFSILEIDGGADAKTIKKAYRKLSLLYHPDKNPGDRKAEAKFMMVSKAYEALTDETARENWEKYGNPDGKQSLEVSMGLPSFLLDTKHRNLVLVAYLLIMVVVIPVWVYSYYSDSSKYGEKNVMYSTYSWYHNALSQVSSVKNVPEVFAGSAEFRKRNGELTGGKALIQSTKALMNKPKYSHPVCMMGSALVHAHLCRKTEPLSQQQTDNLKYMLRMSTSLIDAMISVCKHQDALQTAMHCVEFGQYMTQAIWTKDSNLLQIPHFTPKEVEHCSKGKKPVTTVAQFRAMPAAERKGLADFTAAQKQDVQEFLKLFPDIEVAVKVFTDDDDDDNVYEGDLVTIQVTITRNNFEHDTDKAGLVHAPHFPFPKKEAFWIVLGQLKEGKIISIEKVPDPKKVVVHKIKFLAPPKGTYHFDLIVKSNGYVGVDQQTRVEMTTLDASALPEYKIHPDDAELDDEPTLFEEMMNANVEQESDEEDDSDEDDDEDEPLSAAEKKKAALRKARQADGDDDDSDDSDAEEVYASK